MDPRESWRNSLAKIYDPDTARTLADEMLRRFAPYEGTAARQEDLNQSDCILITYGDTLQSGKEPGLAVLDRFLNQYVGDAIRNVHLLPMFPYTSDDGFSVVDYKSIAPGLGDWKDMAALASHRGLMFDAVINHVSRSSEWFTRFLNCEEPYRDFFIVEDPQADHSKVIRPRTSPLLTPFETREGTKYVWTTFSDDQIDLNYRCPEVLLRVLDVLLFYAANGARFIRLDAVGFMWKEAGTGCMHLPQTHELIKLMRKVLRYYAPGTRIITETNVPHKDNISYFGNGDEADLVYQFPLPPLVMYTLLTGNAAHLREWATHLEAPPEGGAYFNFLSSHDGIGVRPVEGILNDAERQVLVDATLRNGGVVSWKDNGDGTRSPYELNINYQDALAGPMEPDEDRIAKFLAAESILFCLQGVPGLYIHSLLGSRNDYYGKAVSGIPRRINREKLALASLEQQLQENPIRRTIFTSLCRMLRCRASHAAFSPYAAQQILPWGDDLFAIRRTGGGENVLCVVNVTGRDVPLPEAVHGTLLLEDTRCDGILTLRPWQVAWIQND